MKKRVITVLSTIIVLLAAVIFISAAVIGANTPKLNFVLEVPYNSVEAGEEFSLKLKLTNSDLEYFLMSGFQIEIPYDTTAMSVVDIDELQSTNVSQSDFHAENGMIKYVTVKDSFTDTRGYESFNDIFKVVLKAEKDIPRPADLFPANTVKLLPGDTLNRLISNYSLSVFLDGAPTAGITDHIGKSDDVFVVYLYLNNIESAKKITISELTFDKTALTLQAGEWILDNTSSADISLSAGNAKATFTSPADINSDAIKLTFKINSETQDGAYTIGLKAEAECENGTVDLQTVSSTVTVKNIIRGDVNGDEAVDSDDAIYLLYSILFGDSSYPLNQTADFDGNNDTNSDDAIYLLYHVLFGGEIYPLS